MFATCLFCNSALGANDALEHFPVGRRIAYDEAKGRLWVVCRTCERWNLSPLETRWEAIEEAEKAFRATRMRVVSDNIGMAQLNDGLELVRIGPALRPEFAAWRYGDQFGKRFRKYRWLTLGMAAMSLPPLVISGGHVIATMAALPALKAALGGWSAFGSGVSLTSAFTLTGYSRYSLLNTREIPRFSVRDNNGELLRLTTANANLAKLFPAKRDANWYLAVHHVSVQPANGWAKRFRNREMVLEEKAPRILTGDVAQRALGIILPSVNMLGGNKRMVQDAVHTINSATDVQQILRHGGFPDPIREKYIDMSEHQYSLSTFQPHFRLALEMALHESDERRAMEGELKELENRWRDADAIAKIADEMFLPENSDEQMRALRQRKSESE